MATVLEPESRVTSGVDLSFASLSDTEFDALLEAQRAEDEKVTGTEQTNLPKRARDVLTDHEYRLRKERTDNLLIGYKDVILRRLMIPIPIFRWLV